MSDTTIKLKRGSSTKVSVYTEATEGEPVYNLDDRKLYVAATDLGTLIPVDNKYSKGYKFNCTSTQSIFPISPQYDIDCIVYKNGVKLAESEYDVNYDNVTLHTPANTADLINIEVFEKIGSPELPSMWSFEDIASMQNTLASTIKVAVNATGIANREIIRLKTVLTQEGETTIYNRGIISGCTLTKSGDVVRNLNLLAGKLFLHGRIYSVDELLATATVPVNNGVDVATCYVYLWSDTNDIIQCDCTDLNSAIPENGLELAQLSIPAGNDATSDAYLANVTIADTRRIELNWPTIFVNPAFTYIPLNNILPDDGYQVKTEVISFEGGRQQIGEVFVDDRLKNGFKLYLAGSADTVLIRYIVTHLKP